MVLKSCVPLYPPERLTTEHECAPRFEYLSPVLCGLWHKIRLAIRIRGTLAAWGTVADIRPGRGPSISSSSFLHVKGHPTDYKYAGGE